MTDQSDIKSEDIEDFLNESFMIIDELEDNHNAKAEESPSGSKDDPNSSAEKSEVPDGGNAEENPNEAMDCLKKAEIEQNGDVDFEDDTEIEEIASSETYDLDSSGVSKQDVEEKSEDVRIADTNEEDEAEEEDTIDSHPYLYLIESFELTKEQKTLTNIGPPKSFAETPLHMVHTRAELLNLLQTLRSAKEICLDLQADPKVFDDALCLLEISTRDSDYIIDGMKLKNDLLLLTEIFINPKIVKILHSAEYMLGYLQQHLHLFVVNVFDIDKAGMALNDGQSVNFNLLLKSEYSFERASLLNADFRVRPLPEDLKAYCRGTPHYLIHLYHNYKNRLLKNEKLYKDVMDQCRNMCKVLYPDRKKTQFDALERELKKRHACQLEILQKLYDWRESIAKKNNKNPDMILQHTALVNIASNMPHVDTNLFTLCNTHYVKAEVKKITAMVVESKEKHKVQYKRVRWGRRTRQMMSEAAAEALKKETNVPQGAKRQSSENKFETFPNKQKRFETTVVKVKNEKIQTEKKTCEKPSSNHNKQKPADSSRNHGNRRTGSVQKSTKFASNRPSSNKPLPKPSTFVPTRKPNLNKSAPAGAKSATHFKQSPYLNQSAPKPLLDICFNNSPAMNNPSSSTLMQKTRRRKSRFEPLLQTITATPVVLKPTNVPSNSHFQTHPNFNGTPFQGSILNQFQEYSSPLGNFSVKRDNDGLNMHPQGNFIANMGQDVRFNTFNNVFDAIDHKINTLERKVSKFEVTSDPNDMESNMYRRRYN